MTNSAHAQSYNSEHKREHNSDIKRNKLVEFLRIVCWMSGKHTLFSFSKYFSPNTLSQNIEYCSVAFSLLFSIA